MTSGGLGLVFVGVFAWFLVLASCGPRRSVFRVAVEVLSVHAVASTLVAVALVSGGVFSVTSAQALAAAVPVASFLCLRQLPWSRPRLASFITRRELTAVLSLALVAPVAWPRMALLYMDSDAGVYSNRALHHLDEGSLIGTIPVRDRLEGELVELFDRDNVYSETLYRPGAYRLPTDPGRFVFQFFPGWPMLMAQWAGLFGVPNMFYAVLFAFAMAVLFFAFLLQDADLRIASFAVAVLLFASSPLLLYFSKYTTSEVFLLFLFLFVVYCLSQGGAWHTALSVAGLAALVVTHISTFAYAPLVLLGALEAWRSVNRRLTGFSAAAFGVLLLGIPLGILFSPVYVDGIYGAVFRRLGVEEPARAGLSVMVVFYVFGLGVCLAALRRARHFDEAGPPEGGAPKRGSWPTWMIRLSLLAVVAGSVLRGWQLGWTERFTHAPPTGAWAARQWYAGAGWEALAHLNIVNMAMATSLVGLVVVLVFAAWRPERVCSTPLQRFLFGAFLLSLAIHAVARVDTPENYYASRYFIPVFVPATMLLLGLLLDDFRVGRGGIVLLALLGLGFNLPHDHALYQHPTFTDEMRFVEDVASRVRCRPILFGRNLWRSNRMTRRLLSGPLIHEHGIPVVQVLGRGGPSADEIISAYAEQLHLREAAVLSKEPPADGRAFEMVVLVQTRRARARFYPHAGTERRHRFYLYDASFQ